LGNSLTNVRWPTGTQPRLLSVMDRVRITVRFRVSMVRVRARAGLGLGLGLGSGLGIYIRTRRAGARDHDRVEDTTHLSSTRGSRHGVWVEVERRFPPAAPRLAALLQRIGSVDQRGGARHAVGRSSDGGRKRTSTLDTDVYDKWKSVSRD
jgi:hypothetical protein